MEESQLPNHGDETAAQRQARIRRERREAKIKAGGSARLDKITSVAGRPAELVSAAEPLPHTATVVPADPDEVDISSHINASAYTPKEPQASTDNEVRRLLRGPIGNKPPYPNGDGDLFGAGVGNGSFPRILQQLVAGSTSTAGRRGGQEGNGDQSGLPQGLAAMLDIIGAPGPERHLWNEEKQSNNNFGYVWRITHVLFALALSLYMVFMTASNGAQFSRWDNGRATELEVGFRLFWAFAMVQLVLQSTRYLLERGRDPVGAAGWMSMVAGAFPEPWQGRALLLSRYSIICSTIVQDAMVVIFVLGCATWWEGAIS